MAMSHMAPTAPESDSAILDERPALPEIVVSNENAALPGWVTRKLMAVVAWVEHKNSDHAIHAREEFVDPAQIPVRFPWVLDLEQNWSLIRGEVARLMMRKNPPASHATGDAAAIAQDRAWKTFSLISYGFAADETTAQCPETSRLLDKVPGLVTAMFSVLEPGRHLPPHRGPYNGLMRLHLGLIIPEASEDVGIRVADQVQHWQEGRALILDDTFEHEAWNDTDQTRVVLFVDFVRPLRFPARLLNWLVLNVFVFRPFIREGLDRAQWWERRFYREAQSMRAARA